MNTNPLFTPVSIGSLRLPNRFVMAAMTRLFSPGGIISAESARYYRRRAENGVGLIITEGTTISRPVPAFDDNVPRFFGSEALAAWKQVVDEVHVAGGLIAPQLWHAGASRHPMTGATPAGLIDSPSGIFVPGEVENPPVPPMDEAAIADTIAAFARSAADAKRLGFDAVQLHGAHGYLIDQFFWPSTNRRNDRWGGDISGRVRFAVEVIKGTRAAVGPDFPIILRVSQWKSVDYGARVASTPQELEAWLTPLVEAGVDCLDCSTRRIWEPEFPGSDLNLAGWAKRSPGCPPLRWDRLDSTATSSRHYRRA